LANQFFDFITVMPFCAGGLFAAVTDDMLEHGQAVDMHISRLIASGPITGQKNIGLFARVLGQTRGVLTRLSDVMLK